MICKFQIGKHDRELSMEMQRHPMTAAANSTPSVNETGVMTYSKGMLHCCSSCTSSDEMAYVIDTTARYVFPITFILFVGAFLLVFWVLLQS